MSAGRKEKYDPQQELAWRFKHADTPEWMRLLGQERANHLIRTLEALFRGRDEGQWQIEPQTLDVDWLDDKVKARAIAREWIGKEASLHGSYHNQDRLDEAYPYLQQDYLNKFAELLLPYIDDAQSFGLIIAAALKYYQQYAFSEFNGLLDQDPLAVFQAEGESQLLAKVA